MQNAITVLGSTGSIGRQTLDVCRDLDLRVHALTAHTGVEQLAAQARAVKPAVVAVSNPESYAALKAAVRDLDVRVMAGPEALCELAAAPESGTVVGAVVGVAGLAPTLAAASAGKRIALANKEPLVAGGALVTEAVRRHGAQLIPVDSEHSAIFQCLQAGERADLRRILLTASGGPFFGKGADALRYVRPQDALKHPNWSMGAKITVDSATMMNKGLELIEAMWLFGVKPDEIEVVIHRQSIVHSAVEFADGAVIAQLGVPDMRTAIQYALTWPHRCRVSDVPRLSLVEAGTLTFEQPDRETFRCLPAMELAARKGGLYPAAANAAGEAAVAAFLQGQIPFLRIGELVCEAVEQLRLPREITLDAIVEVDALARERVRGAVEQA